MKRRRKPQSLPPNMTPEELRIHRELQYLRAAGLTRNRKPSLLARARGLTHRKNNVWVYERWRKWRETSGR